MTESTRQSTTDTTAIEPVVATVVVPADAATAFEIFTSGMGTWWPLADFSLGAERIVAVEFDEHAGGEVREVWDDGTRRKWADVLTWDPPRSMALAWGPGGFEQGREPTTVEVTFTETEPGTTQLRLVHTGWEVWADAAREARDEYDGGWVVVLGGFAAKVTG